MYYKVWGHFYILVAVWGVVAIIIRIKNRTSNKKTDLGIGFFIAFPVSIVILLVCRLFFGK